MSGETVECSRKQQQEDKVNGMEGWKRRRTNRQESRAGKSEGVLIALNSDQDGQENDAEIKI